MAQSTSSTGNQPLIELRHVDKHYGDLHVLNDINLSVDRGEVVVVIGPSGSGKSTMCRTINRLETIDSGEILIEGEPLPQEGKDLARMRAELGMVFQQFNLFAHMTVLQNVMLGPVDVLGVSKEEARERAMDLLSRVGVAEQADKVPAQLSGGQQQRVSIARTLALNPEVILFDEPMSALDVETRLSLRLELKRIQREFGTTMVYITHDQEEALSLIHIFYSFVKLVDTTTRVLENFVDKKTSTGVWVDIFPLEDLKPGDRRPYRKNALLSLVRGFIVADPSVGSSAFVKLVKRIVCPFARRLDALKYARAIDENARDANRGERSDVVADIVGTENKIFEFPRSLFDPVEMPFEDRVFLAPAGYERFLELQYGDWRAIPGDDDREIHTFEAYRL